MPARSGVQQLKLAPGDDVVAIRLRTAFAIIRVPGETANQLPMCRRLRRYEESLQRVNVKLSRLRLATSSIAGS